MSVFLFAFMFIDVLIYSLSLLVITWEFGCIYLLLAYMSVFLCAFKFIDVLIYSSSLLVITWEFGSLCLGPHPWFLEFGLEGFRVFRIYGVGFLVLVTRLCRERKTTSRLRCAVLSFDFHVRFRLLRNSVAYPSQSH